MRDSWARAGRSDCADAMLYTEALEYLYSLANYERIPIDAYAPETLNLDRMRAVLARLGNPQERYRTITWPARKAKARRARSWRPVSSSSA